MGRTSSYASSRVQPRTRTHASRCSATSTGFQSRRNLRPVRHFITSTSMKTRGELCAGGRFSKVGSYKMRPSRGGLANRVRQCGDLTRPISLSTIFSFPRTSNAGPGTFCVPTLGILCRSRLVAVRRLAGLLLAHSLVVSSAMASSMHVHEYAEHDHPDHHHGPASHEHKHSASAEQDHHSPTDDDHAALQAESCDAGRHAVAVTLVCAQVPHGHVDLGDLPAATTIAPAAPIRSTTPVVDVRVHGPPFDVRVPARAPPLTPHA